ncbi:hypothetical protein TYRP_006755 [Tyrophagus putrescentiae]|nr:hypothetical protein TYRP_006755 [Tyrophagus putrescentiae]
MLLRSRPRRKETEQMPIMFGRKLCTVCWVSLGLKSASSRVDMSVGQVVSVLTLQQTGGQRGDEQWRNEQEDYANVEYARQADVPQEVWVNHHLLSISTWRPENGLDGHAEEEAGEDAADAESGAFLEGLSMSAIIEKMFCGRLQEDGQRLSEGIEDPLVKRKIVTAVEGEVEVLESGRNQVRILVVGLGQAATGQIVHVIHPGEATTIAHSTVAVDGRRQLPRPLAVLLPAGEAPEYEVTFGQLSREVVASVQGAWLVVGRPHADGRVEVEALWRKAARRLPGRLVTGARQLFGQIPVPLNAKCPPLGLLLSRLI